MPIDFHRYDYVKDAVRVTRYRDAEQVLVGRSFLSGAFEHESAPFKKDTIFEINGSAHMERRRALSPLFTRSAATSYEMETLVRSLRDQLHALAIDRPDEQHIAVDLVRFTRLAMVSVAARIIGIDAEGRLDRLLELADPLGAATDVKWSDRPHGEVVQEGTASKEAFLSEFVMPAIEQRLGSPPGTPSDLLSTLIEKMGPSQNIDADVIDELARESIIFLAAGVRTTAHAVTHTLHELWRTQGAKRFQELSVDELREAAVEGLRLHPPAPALVRQATEDVVLPSGLEVRKGDLVALDLESSNRDQEVFGPDADVFRLDRDLPQGVHGYGLSFGAGPHVCLGKGLSVSATTQTASDGSLRTVVRVLETLRDLGLEPDPDRTPEKMVSGQDRWETYPVLIKSDLLQASWA